MKKVLVNVSRSTSGFIALPIVALLLQSCGSTVDLASNWSNSPVVVDGKADEWSSSLTPMKDAPVSLGMKNDQDYLYLCLESSDRDFHRQVMGAGMTIWFEPKSGDKIGIRYPLGMAGMGQGAGSGGPFGEMPSSGPPEGGQPEMGNPGQGMGGGRSGSMPEIVRELEILGPGKNDVDRMPVAQATGIELKLGQSSGMMIYELKIPLKKTQNHPFAIASEVGSKVDVSFETNKATRPSGGPGGMSGGPGTEGGGVPGSSGPGGMGPGPGGMGPVGGGGDGGGPPSGGMPGGGMGGGRRGGPGGERGPGGGKAEQKQFKLEAEVTLASGSASNTAK